MASEVELLSLVLTLRPLAAGAGQASLGRAAHAVLLDAIRAADPALAEQLHAGSGLRPFTASNLVGYSPRRGLRPERTYGLRFTTLTGPVARALLAAAQPGGPLSVGAVVRLDENELRVEGVADQPKAHPWAAALSYEALSAPWLLGRAAPEPRLALHFASPATFKSGGLHVPAPLPGLVFGGLLERWNAFAPVALPAETRRFVDECLALTAYRLSTRMVMVKEGGLRAGAVGEARYTAVNHDRYWLSLLNLLADFALFAGVGAGTSMGLGQVRRVGASTGRPARQPEASDDV